MSPAQAQIVLDLHESGRAVAPLEKVDEARRVLAEALEDELGGGA